MKLIATLLTAVFFVSCGVDSNETNNSEKQLQQITGDEANAVAASAKDAPAKVVSRIPVVNGELQHDKAVIVTVDENTETSSEEAIVNAFNSKDQKENVAELDADTSSDSFGYRYGYARGYRWGYGAGATRGCGWGGCGVSRSVYYGATYSYGGSYRAAYQPYNYGFGCQNGGYYYASYSRGSSYYSYGNPGCGGYSCGGSYGNYGSSYGSYYQSW